MKCFVASSNSHYSIQINPEQTFQSVFGNVCVYADSKIYTPQETFSNVQEFTILTPVIPLNGGMQIFIRQLSGKTISLDLPAEDAKVEEIKQLIYDKEKINIDAQALYCAGKQMSDGHSITEYGIQAETVIHLIVNMSQHPSVSNQEDSSSQPRVQESNPEEGAVSSNEPYQLMIQSMNKEQTMIDLPSGDRTTIADVKQILGEKKGYQKQQITLYYSGKPLDDAQTLKDYSIPNSSVLTLVLQVK
jgi:ubiquitin C